MSSQPHNTSGDYQPASTVNPPVIYSWPPRLAAALKYLLLDMMFPWNYLFVGLAYLAWTYFTPAMSAMATFEFAWFVQIWLRNAVVLTLIAGGLHWWLYIRRAQGQEFKFDRKWQATGNRRFLWGDQVRDNMFWCLTSGITIASIYEAVTFWLYANGYVAAPELVGEPAYLIACIYGVFFLGTAHFYCIHRFLHWPPLYKISHELHHRNINIGPWTGISMHPIEHLLYFSVFALTWVIPVHPFIIVLLSLWFIAGPATSHSGFDYLKIGGFKIGTGDWFHQLHHQHFNLNYGNTQSPLDYLFGSWHNGSEASLREQRERMRARVKG